LGCSSTRIAGVCLAKHRFCEEHQRAKKTKRSLRFTPVERQKLKIVDDYIHEHRSAKWAREIQPWQELLRRELK